MPLPLTATQPTIVSKRLDGVLDWAQMLSGAGLVLFLFGHLILVAGVIPDPRFMDAVAAFLARTYLLKIGGPLILPLFFVHVLLTARKAPFRFEGQKLLWRHAAALRHADTWLWMVQVVTGAIILVMGAVHMWLELADQPIAALKSAARVQTGGWLAFYLLLLPTTELHVGIGVYRIAVKWGFLKRAARRNFKKRLGVLTLVLIAVGLAALARFRFLAA